MKDIIQKKWLESKMPGINCVIKSDLEIIILNNYRNEKGALFSFPLCKTTIESIINYNEDIWTEIQVFIKIVDEDKDLIYLGGEGGMGNEGFLACTNSLNKYIWGMFFENSNPFIKLEINDDELYAFSTSGELYIIDLKMPEHIFIK